MLLNFDNFILEAIIAKFTKSIDFDFGIHADGHFFDRLSRYDNELDSNNVIVIDEKEVINDIKKAIPIIVKKNLFNIGLYWDSKNNDTLNKEILITNTNTNLNIILIIDKFKENKYKFTIKTVMRKKKFIPSTKQMATEIIYIE